MRELSPSPSQSPSLAVSRRPTVAVVAAGVVATVLAATLVLWMHYGPSVFFEMVAAGIAACF
jgi:hypothetical protein